MAPLILEGGWTLEVRWIRPGGLSAAMIDWFAPHVVEMETREDLYLVRRGVQGLSVKIRGGTLLDIKVSSGDVGAIEVPRRAHGRSLAWKKWSFPLSASLETGAGSSDWVRVGKYRRIRRFSFKDGKPVAPFSASSAGATTCAVELTEVTSRGESWWTLGFEAGGHPDQLGEAIEATAALLFSEPLPAGELSVDDSMSYANWLRPSDPGATPRVVSTR